VYPLGPGEQEALQKFLKEHLDKGYVCPSKSPYASPFFFIKKKDGKLRPVQDYRKLNALTIRNHYPLPLIPKLIDHIRGHSLFTKLDIQWGYNNIRICDGDQWKAAFKTNQGLFEPMVMFFGLTNSPVTIPGIRAGRPDRPGRAMQTKTRSTVRTTERQRRYNESTFSARLAEALRRHGVAVRTARTSSSVMDAITNQLARFADTGSKSSSDEDVPARHGPHGPERPPRR
jgi:Reverse transcriptase (RNA-dependent DNA polymerase)